MAAAAAAAAVYSDHCQMQSDRRRTRWWRPAVYLAPVFIFVLPLVAQAILKCNTYGAGWLELVNKQSIGLLAFIASAATG